VTQLVDDQFLGRILRGETPPQPDTPVFTTGYWYVRLCQAVLGAADRTGVLSAPFAALPVAVRQRAIDALLHLPEPIGLLSLRQLGPTIGRLRHRHDLNILATEALAAAADLHADVYLSAPSPKLERALRAEGRQVTVLAS
jgi:hypothetical protein